MSYLIILNAHIYVIMYVLKAVTGPSTVPVPVQVALATGYTGKNIPLNTKREGNFTSANYSQTFEHTLNFKHVSSYP